MIKLSLLHQLAIHESKMEKYQIMTLSLMEFKRGLETALQVTEGIKYLQNNATVDMKNLMKPVV